MITQRGLSRRKLLNMTGSTMLLYPLMRVLELSDAKAAAAILPRVIFTHYSCGSEFRDFWANSTSGSLGSLARILAPLQAHKADLTVLQGICTRGTSDHGGAPFQVLAGWGISPTAINHNPVEVNASTAPKTPYSLDQMLGDRWGQKTLKKVVLVGSGTQEPTLNNFISYNKSGAGVACVQDPKTTYNDIFGGFKAASGEVSNFALAEPGIKSGRKRIIDYLRDDVRRIESALGPLEKEMFGAHVATLDEIAVEIERQEAINNPTIPPKPDPVKPDPVKPDPMEPKPPVSDGRPPRLDACNPKSINPNVPVNDYAAVRRINNQILVQALACGITRVGVNAFAVSDPFVNYGGGPYHTLSHGAALSGVQTEFMKSVAELATMLKNVKTASGTLFDETLITCSSDISQGNAHDGINVPWFLLGNLGGKLKGNRQIVFPFEKGGWARVDHGMDHNRVLITIAALLGEGDIKEVGSKRFVGVIPQILG